MLNSELDKPKKDDDFFAQEARNPLNQAMRTLMASQQPQGLPGGGFNPLQLVKNPNNLKALSNPIGSVAAETGTSVAAPATLGMGQLLKLLGLNVGSSALGALFGGGDDGQKKQSYSNTKGLSPDIANAIDPRMSLFNAITAIQRAGQMQQDKLREGYRLRTVAQAPPGFAKDPAETNPDILKYNGRETYDTFQGIIPEMFKRAGNPLKGGQF